MSKENRTERGDTDREHLRQIGDNIRAARKRMEYTQEQLADIAGFSRSYYTEIETGKRNISILNLLKIMRALKAEANEIIGPVNRESGR